eukprot:m.136892 g.136892  ORF g.136892 m.136892 type:complete len:86 (-) comp52482_c0_seq5:135-392(-)
MSDFGGGEGSFDQCECVASQSGGAMARLLNMVLPLILSHPLIKCTHSLLVLIASIVCGSLSIISPICSRLLVSPPLFLSRRFALV